MKKSVKILIIVLCLIIIGLVTFIIVEKIANKNIRLNTINKIDAEISTQKFFGRFSYKNKYISHNNYFEWSKKLDEIGKIIGGWIKSCLRE